MSCKPKKLIFATISQVELHPDLPPGLVQAYSALNHVLEPASEYFSQASVQIFLQTHPIQVIQRKRPRNTFWCIAGLRGWQLAKACLLGKQAIPLILWQRLSEDEIAQLAWAETYLAHLAFHIPDSLMDSGIVPFWQALPQELKAQLAPRLKHKTRLSKIYRGDRRLLSTVVEPPSSQLKAMAHESK